MKTFLLFAIPSLLVIIGMILNSLRISFDQPASSPEQDPGKRLEAERQAYRTFFDLQRNRSLKRQKRVGQFAWLVLAVFVVSFVWLYFETVNATTAAKRISALQTVPTAEGKETVLTVILSDGNNAKYLIKSATGDGASDAAVKGGFTKEAVSSWELSSAGTALSVGDSVLPLGIALRISN